VRTVAPRTRTKQKRRPLSGERRFFSRRARFADQSLVGLPAYPEPNASIKLLLHGRDPVLEGTITAGNLDSQTKARRAERAPSWGRALHGLSPPRLCPSCLRGRKESVRESEGRALSGSRFFASPIYLSMTNNCVEVEDSELGQDQPRCSGTSADEEQQTLAERFAAGLAQAKVEAECLDGRLWEELGEREKAARVLTATGFSSKGSRYRDCHVYGIPVDCVACGERYYSRYRCTLRYCEHCGPWHFSRLMRKYRAQIAHRIGEQPSQYRRTLARLTFTVRAYDQMPSSEEPRRLNKLLRQWFKRMMQHGVVWGCIFAIETGHELATKHPGRQADGWNLHVHALYYGPFLDQTEGLRLWRELLGDSGGFRIEQCSGWRKDPERAVRRALVHHFGYIMKPAAVSGERIAALEVLFSGIRRVHALGCFYRLPQSQKDTPSPRCPKCGEAFPVNLRAWRRSERRPVADLEVEGRRDWRTVDAAIRRARAFGWGQGP